MKFVDTDFDADGLLKGALLFAGIKLIPDFGGSIFYKILLRQKPSTALKPLAIG